MFKFLKDKLKKAISVFSKKAEEEAEEEVIEVEKEVEVKEEKKEVKKPKKVEKPKPKVEKPKEVPKKKEIKVEEPIKEIPEEVKVEKVEEKPTVEVKEEKPEVVEEEIPAKIEKVIEKKKEEKKGFFTRLFKKEVKEDIIPEEVKKEVEELIEEKPEEVKVEEVVEKPTVEEEVKEEKIEEEKPTVEEEVKEEKIEEVKEEVEEEVKEEKIEEEKPTVEEEVKEEKIEEVKEEEEPKEEVEEPKGFFQKIKQKITTKKISGKQFQDMFWELEVAMLENNVAVEVIEKIKQDLEKELVDTPIQRGKVEDKIIASLKKSIEDLFIEPSDDFIKTITSKKPYVICFVGINGSGKTTSMAKVAHMLQKKGLSVVLAASDTFRAAAIDQLQTHADKLGVKLIKHEYGSDAAAVAFDAIKHAESKGIDVVLIDTAGRLHSNVNLMDEMKKIMKVANPDMKIFVGESITGNDCVEQAKKFDEAVSLDGIILSKADVDEKGGAAISVSFVTGKPIYFLGMGQEYDDLEVFNSQKIMDSLGL